MSKHSPQEGKRSWAPLGWLGLYLLDLGLIVLFQALFVHTVPLPLTKDSLAELPYFSGCEILDVSRVYASRDALVPKTEPDFVLYRDPGGEVRLVRLEWNLFLPRFRIERDTVQTIPPGEGEETVLLWTFSGTDEVMVTDQRALTFVRGAWRQQRVLLGAYLVGALFLLCVEFSLPSLWRRFLKRRDPAAEPDFPAEVP